MLEPFFSRSRICEASSKNIPLVSKGRFEFSQGAQSPRESFTSGLQESPLVLPAWRHFPSKAIGWYSSSPKDHPVAKRRQISFSETLSHDFVGLAEASTF